MEEEELPERMFQTGEEHDRDSRINSYITLRLIETIKTAIEVEHMEQLLSSQFRRVMQMGHHTFSVRFVHYILCRQLVTKKQYELWWLYAGKPIRFGINGFVLVTGLMKEMLVCGNGQKENAAEKVFSWGKCGLHWLENKQK